MKKKQVRKIKYDPVQYARIDIGVTKQRYVSYKGERISYERIIRHPKIGCKEYLIQLLNNLPKPFESPPGLYGGMCSREQANNVINILSSWGFKRDKFSITVRYFVTSCGGLCPNTPPNKVTRLDDWSRHNCVGFEKRSEANEAAMERYQYFVAWCVDDKKKITSSVTLTLTDKDGNVTKKLTNKPK